MALTKRNAALILAAGLLALVGGATAIIVMPSAAPIERPPVMVDRERSQPEIPIEWVDIPGGSYAMGCSPGDNCRDNEKPLHAVNVRAFRMGKYEATQGQFQKVFGRNPSNFTACGANCPVEQVTWEEARDFCTNVGGRLPTEEEWEYAARAGMTRGYYCQEDFTCFRSVAWFVDNAGRQSHPVGQKRANGFGLYDMLGNVWEWTNDCWSNGYSDAKDCRYRVFRGGSLNSRAGALRFSLRYGDLPDIRWLFHGVRCAQDVAS
ncbi:MAG: formylglycine-generating enzyme family protein [Kiritimatiellae bacterium]|nr:formylglycine-generating enzyme family protein [Kiritimatiellia bacterium]